ncbi:hypothetical protein MIMGU_mgv1a019786mg [Erythranthe guttata]|uniref:Uncharacterized protein n=1 Tax=Erythranthe guttata TaxID=4155 RepID=A0A022QTK8_ERYGU|nr:hypothetical protein MIMGU_mgv1a019786mg [Erythranthe guttata]
MGRKCSECGKVGHNSRTCTTSASRSGLVADDRDDDVIINGGGGGIRLFGVRIDDDVIISSSALSSSLIITPMKKSLRFDSLPIMILTPPAAPSSSSSSSIYDNSDNNNNTFTAGGYLSDDPLIHQPPERRKGVPWTEDEHRTFLDGLEKLGKGDWRGISREYVSTRTPTQIASHAQKYFLRQTTKKTKHRSSLFDMVIISIISLKN